MGAFTGINGVTKETAVISAGANGTSRLVKDGYAGVDGVVKRVFHYASTPARITYKITEPSGDKSGKMELYKEFHSMGMNAIIDGKLTASFVCEFADGSTLPETELSPEHGYTVSAAVKTDCSVIISPSGKGLVTFGIFGYFIDYQEGDTNESIVIPEFKAQSIVMNGTVRAYAPWD